MIALPPTHRRLVLPEMHRELEKYRPQIEELVRPAWLLNVEAAATVARNQTHFLGDSLYMPASMGWPSCDNCSNPLTFMWQVNFAEFSGSEMFEERGLFQFFYCWTCFPLPMSPQELDGLPDPMAYGYLATGYDRSSGVHYRWYPALDAHSPLAEEQMCCPSEEYVWGPPLGIWPVPILSLPHSWGDEDPIGDMLVELDEEEKYDVLVTVDTYGDCISQLGGYPV
jgi:hypothetical protein